MTQLSLANAFVGSLRQIASRDVAKRMRELLDATQNPPGRDGTLGAPKWEALRKVVERLEALILAVEKYEQMR